MSAGNAAAPLASAKALDHHRLFVGSRWPRDGLHAEVKGTTAL